MNKCTIPPIGWRCTRAAGHSGPCAAMPDEALPLSRDEEIFLRFVDGETPAFLASEYKRDVDSTIGAIRRGARTELSTLRATRDADHGAAIEAADYYWLCRMMAADAEQELCKNGTDTSCDQTSLCVTEYCIPCAARAWMNDQRRLEAMPVTNSQQKGGEEPCAAPAQTGTTTKIQAAHSPSEAVSNAAPTSDPEGAATQDQIGILSCDNHRMRKFGTLLAEAALYVIREYDGTHRLSLAVSAWAKAIGDEGGRGLLDTTPSPTLEKLAQEIDGLYEAPSRIRPLRRILEREFGASRSVSEAADEIMELPNPFRDDDKAIRRDLESILSGFREHELRELREECGRLKFLINERHAMLGYIESSRDINTRAVSSGCLDLNNWLVGLRKYAKDFDDAIQLSAQSK